VSDRNDPHVRETDAFTFRMERDPLLRSTITAVAVLDRAPDWDVLVERIDRATRLVPSFRSRLVPSPLNLAPPRWVIDSDFDITWHLRRVECPPHDTVDTVLVRAQIAATTAFDPARPLWRFTLFEGLAEGKSALLMKVHHSLTDGIGGIELAAYVVDLPREPQDLGPLPPAPQAHPHRSGDDLTEAATFAVRRWTALAGSAAGSLPGGVARSIRDPFGLVTDVATTARSIARFVQPVTTTLSPVMTKRSLNRHFSRLDVELAGLRSAATAAGATLNDAYLAGILGGMRRYHEHHGAPVEALRLTLPISIRQKGDAVAGNRVTLTRLAVPVAVRDPIERMGRIGETVRRARDEPALRFSEGIASALNLLPPGVTGSMLKHVDLVATNVPGFTESVYVGGALIEAFYPYAPNIGASVNVGLLSYRDRCYIGISSDPAAIPDPEVFLACLTDGFDEVIAAGRDEPTA
jgi:diacylglycerol O-acyltransferase / wax synthase